MIRAISKSYSKKLSSLIIQQNSRFLHDDFTSSPDKTPAQLKAIKALPKFQVFRDSESQIILDVEEERQAIDGVIEQAAQMPQFDIDINLERGLRGVFEIEDLVTLLKKDNGIEICVCKVPNELQYVDYICCVTGRNHRHMLGMAEYVRKVFKAKRHGGDRIPRIEGAESNDWIAMDLGNIALHIMSDESRKKYDIESLWCCQV